MLEEKITQLNSSIIELTAVLINFAEISQLPKTTEPKNNKAETAKPKTKKKETPPDPKPDTKKTPDRDAIQDFCLKLVRLDSKNGAKIKKLIKDHGGELIKDVPDDKLAALKVALEGI